MDELQVNHNSFNFKKIKENIVQNKIKWMTLKCFISLEKKLYYEESIIF